MGVGKGLALEAAWVRDSGTEVQTYPSLLVPKLYPQKGRLGLPPLGPEATQPQGLFLVGSLGLLPSATAHLSQQGLPPPTPLSPCCVSTRAASTLRA